MKLQLAAMSQSVRLSLFPLSFFIALAFPFCVVAAPVYEEDFDKELPPGVFSHDKQKLEIFTAPKGQRVLGPVRQGTLTLHLDKLPPHRALRVSFDYCLAGWWDGTPWAGPDLVSFGLKDGPELLSTTFSNQYKLYIDKKWQNFPENYRPEQLALVRRLGSIFKSQKLEAPMDGILQRGGLGALQHDYLGCSVGPGFTDMRYRLDFVFLHRGEHLDFLYTEHSKSQGNWAGFDQIRVEALTELPSPKLFAVDWQVLLGDEPMAALAAKYRLALHPDLVRQELRRYLPGDPPASLPALIAALDQRGPGRDQARRQILELGAAARNELQDALAVAKTAQPERQEQLESLLAELRQRQPPAPELTTRQLWRLADLARLCGDECRRDFAEDLESMALDALKLKSRSSVAVNKEDRR